MLFFHNFSDNSSDEEWKNKSSNKSPPSRTTAEVQRRKTVKKEEETTDHDSDDSSDPKHHCKFCPFKTSFKPALKRHMTQTHPDQDAGEKEDETEVKSQEKSVTKETGPIIQCENCPFKTPYKASMRRHAAKHAEGKVCCLPCRKFFLPEDYKEHVKNHKIRAEKLIKYRIDGDPPSYYCNECEFLSSSQHNFVGHLESVGHMNLTSGKFILFVYLILIELITFQLIDQFKILMYDWIGIKI